MENTVLKITLAVAALIGCGWLFNHVDAWVGILATIATGTIIIKQLLKTTK